MPSISYQDPKRYTFLSLQLSSPSNSELPPFIAQTHKLSACAMPATEVSPRMQRRETKLQPVNRPGGRGKDKGHHQAGAQPGREIIKRSIRGSGPREKEERGVPGSRSVQGPQGAQGAGTAGTGTRSSHQGPHKPPYPWVSERGSHLSDFHCGKDIPTRTEGDGASWAAGKPVGPTA